jgi:hypothetical protein
VFASVGIRQAAAEEFRTALVAAASNSEARLGIANPYGQRYIIDFDLVRPDRTVKVRSTWIVRIGEELPRLTSCYYYRRLVMTGIEMLSVVALLEDLPEEGLVRGQVGTVVESWTPGVYEVEFCDDNGKTYALVALKAEQLIRLHHEPVNQAA